jgi:hypothetical protein
MPLINNVQCCFESSNGRVANKRWYFTIGGDSGTGFQRVVSFQLQDISVPSSFLVIGDYITNPIMTLQAGGSWTSAPLPSGNYTEATLATALQTLLNTNTLGLVITVTYDNTTNLFTIAAGAPFTLVPTALAEWLGFDSVLPSASHTSTSVCLVSGPPVLYLQSNALASLQQGVQSSLSTFTAGVVGAIPLTQGPPGINVYQFAYLKHLPSAVPHQIREIDFTFLYPDGRQVDLRGANWSIDFVLNTLDVV